MVGYIKSESQVLYGWLQDDHNSVKGVIVSDISGNSGVFIITTNPDATNNDKQICLYLRKKNGEFSQTCVADPGNKFQLYAKTPKQIELDTLSQLTDDITHTLSEKWMWNGMHSNNAHYGMQIKEVIFNYNSVTKLVIKSSKIFTSFFI